MPSSRVSPKSGAASPVARSTTWGVGAALTTGVVGGCAGVAVGVEAGSVVGDGTGTGVAVAAGAATSSPSGAGTGAAAGSVPAQAATNRSAMRDTIKYRAFIQITEDKHPRP